MSETYRVIYGLGVYEDYDDALEADRRCDEIHRTMVEVWPALAGTSDAALPRVIPLSDHLDDSV